MGKEWNQFLCLVIKPLLITEKKKMITIDARTSL